MYGTHGILSMNKGIAAPIMTAMEDTMNSILRVCWFIFIVCVIVLFFIFDEIDVFVGFTHKILFARDLFNDIFVGFQFFYSTVVVFGRIVLCRYLFTQVVDFGIVFYALYTAVFIDVEKLLKDADLRKNMGENGWLRFKSDFTLEAFEMRMKNCFLWRNILISTTNSRLRK